MILGLDVSTSCTGWCIINDEEKVLDIGYISLSKFKNSYKKASVVEESLKQISKKYKIKKIFIEENLQAFRPGLSSAKTLSTLARFNGIVSLLSYQVFNVEPDHLNVNAARKSLGIKILKQSKCGKNTKEQILDWAKTQTENFEFEWPKKTLRAGPRKGLEIFDPVCYDMADAYVISRAGILF